MLLHLVEDDAVKRPEFDQNNEVLFAIAVFGFLIMLCTVIWKLLANLPGIFRFHNDEVLSAADPHLVQDEVESVKFVFSI